LRDQRLAEFFEKIGLIDDANWYKKRVAFVSSSLQPAKKVGARGGKAAVKTPAAAKKPIAKKPKEALRKASANTHDFEALLEAADPAAKVKTQPIVENEGGIVRTPSANEFEELLAAAEPGAKKSLAGFESAKENIESMATGYEGLLSRWQNDKYSVQ